MSMRFFFFFYKSKAWYVYKTSFKRKQNESSWLNNADRKSQSMFAFIHRPMHVLVSNTVFDQ